VTFFVAAAVMVAGVVAGLFWRVPEIAHLDREPAIYWPEPRLAFDPEPDGGAVLVTVQTTIAADRGRPSSRPWSTLARLGAEPALLGALSGC
jgi:hypothetical protein